jgi:predicted transcriptional regulator
MSIKVSEVPPGRLFSVRLQTRLAEATREMRQVDNRLGRRGVQRKRGRPVGLLSARNLVTVLDRARP